MLSARNISMTSWCQYPCPSQEDICHVTSNLRTTIGFEGSANQSSVTSNFCSLIKKVWADESLILTWNVDNSLPVDSKLSKTKSNKRTENVKKRKYFYFRKRRAISRNRPSYKFRGSFLTHTFGCLFVTWITRSLTFIIFSKSLQCPR